MASRRRTGAMTINLTILAIHYSMPGRVGIVDGVIIPIRIAIQALRVAETGDERIGGDEAAQRGIVAHSLRYGVLRNSARPCRSGQSRRR